MIKLSGVIITFNEEKNIERCLKSLIDIADEVIVLDSFSTDKTKEICAKYNVKFFEHKFDNYVNQKNRALEFANNFYILSLDADEELSDELKNSIREVKNYWKYDSYMFNRLTFFCRKPVMHCGWYPDAKIRLWDKRTGKWTGNQVHEVVKIDRNANIGFLNGDLLHYSFLSIEQHINQINKFSTIKAQVLHEKHKNTNIFKIIFSPFLKFLNSYIFKLGFLDGFYGFVICINSAHSKFLTYSKLYQYNKKQKND